MFEHIRTNDGHSIPLLYERSEPGGGRRLTILSHGIFTDKHEKGRFDRLSARLLDSGSDVIRFDFRGHGQSSLSSSHFSVTGALIDLETICSSPLVSQYDDVNVIGSSFGGSIVLLYLGIPKHLKFRKMVFLNPVVDYKRTFTQADLEWGQEIFSSKVIEQLLSEGVAVVTESFRMSIDCFHQLLFINPYEEIKKIDTPTLIFHGDHDDKVSCQITRDHFKASDLISIDIVNQAGHAFKSPTHEEYVHRNTVSWISND